MTPNGPLNRGFDPTSPHSSLSHGTYLTNMHYHFKLPRIIVENGLCIKKILDFDIRCIDPHGPQTKTCGANYLSFLGEHISLTKINNNHFKDIRDSFSKHFENILKMKNKQI